MPLSLLIRKHRAEGLEMGGRGGEPPGSCPWGELGLLKGSPGTGSRSCRQQSIPEHPRRWEPMGALRPEGAQEVRRVTAGPRVFAKMSPSTLPRRPEGRRGRSASIAGGPGIYSYL